MHVQQRPAADAWLAAMEAGDFEAAWRASDAVLRERRPEERDDPSQPYHLRWVWDGRPFDDRAVLVRCYHGLGDTIQFSRFLPMLATRVRTLTIECQAPLCRLMAGLVPSAQVVPFDVARPLPPAECDLEVMELCHALRSRPDPRPYFTVPTGGRQGDTGVCWRVNASWQPSRSLPDEAAQALLRGLAGRSPCSLQRGATLPGLADDCPSDLMATAARIASLDLVITVDTMVAHLAGAIGVPVCLLLEHEPDWRWLPGRPGSAWYRGVRQYRQERSGEWMAAIERLLADLTVAHVVGTLPGGAGF